MVLTPGRRAADENGAVRHHSLALSSTEHGDSAAPPPGVRRHRNSSATIKEDKDEQ
jgi:hypothetical protein